LSKKGNKKVGEKKCSKEEFIEETARLICNADENV